MDLKTVKSILLILVLLFTVPAISPLSAQEAGTISTTAGDEKLNALIKKAEQGDATAQLGLGLSYGAGLGVKKDYAKAVKWFRKATEQGNAEAQFLLGVMYENGAGVQKDYAEAVKWLRKAAEQGYAKAQYNLGLMYYEGWGVQKDYASAVKWYRKAAEQGYAKAQFLLGVIYYNGWGVQKNYAETVKWYRKAAEQGIAEAQDNLGLMYSKGQGVQQDYAKAVKWYRKAAEQGYAKAQYNLGLVYKKGWGVRKDYAKAVKWFRKAAEQGNVLAQYNLGTMYYRGLSIQKNYTEAVKWWLKAAEQGDANAQYNLGVMYEKGQSVHKDNSEAVKWYRKAAEQGNSEAQFNLGVMYEKGQSVHKDNSEAVKWLRKAAAQGNVLAQTSLNQIYEKGQGGQENFSENGKPSPATDTKPFPAKAVFFILILFFSVRYLLMKRTAMLNQRNAVAQELLDILELRNPQDSSADARYLKDAEQGDVTSQFFLGRMYENGLGVPKNNAEAVKWYRKAAEQGDKQAQANLDRIYEKDKRVHKNNAGKGRASPEIPTKPFASSSDKSLNAFLKEAELENTTAQTSENLLEIINIKKPFHQNKNNDERKDWFSRTRPWHKVDGKIIAALIEKFGDNPMFEVFVITSMKLNLVTQYEQLYDQLEIMKRDFIAEYEQRQPYEQLNNREFCEGTDFICSLISKIICDAGSASAQIVLTVLQQPQLHADLTKYAHLYAITLDALESAIILDKNQISAYYQLAIITRLTNQTEDARKYAKRCLAILHDIQKEDNPFHLSEIYQNAKQNFDEMEKGLRQLIED